MRQILEMNDNSVNHGLDDDHYSATVFAAVAECRLTPGQVSDAHELHSRSSSSSNSSSSSSSMSVDQVCVSD